jgi:PAS domain S-box-containing protein
MSRPTLVANAALAAAFVASGWLGLQLPPYVGNFTLIWLPGGVAVFFLLRQGWSCVPGLVAGSLALTAVPAADWRVGLGVALANVVGPLLVAALLRRWGFDAAFRRARDLPLLAAAALAGMGVNAALGGLWVVALQNPGLAAFTSMLQLWWLSDALGVVLVTPVLLALRSAPELRSRAWEFAAWAATSLALGAAVFFVDFEVGARRVELPYLAIPAAVWAALRFGFPGTALGCAVTAGFALVSLVHRTGPFLQPSRPAELVEVTAFITTVLFVSWLAWSLLRSRDETEARLRSAQENAELTAAGSTDGFWDWDIATDTGYYPERWQRHLGYSEADRAGRGIREFLESILHPDDRAELQRRLADHFERRAPYAVEFRLRHKDGSWRWILSRGQAKWDAAGRPVRMAGSHTDITERRSQQETLRLLDVCLEHLNDAVVICTAGDLAITYVNASFCRTTGYAREEALGRNPRFLAGPETSRRMLGEMRAALRAGRPFRGEVLHYTKAGGRFWGEIDLAPVAGADGVPSHWVAVMRDVSVRKQAEAERAGLEENLRQAQKTELLGSLAGGVAHNFNNLLTGINGFIQLARGELPAAHPAAALLQRAQRTGESAAELVRQILAVARRGDPGVRRILDLAALVRDTHGLLRATLPAGITVTTSVPEGPCWVLGEPAQLQQVLVNLAVNGAHAIGEGPGRLEVTLAAAPLSPLLGPAWRLAVRDDGCGIEPSLHETIFEPFYTTKPAGVGTGLGLPLVRGMVVAHGGRIEVESSPGAGSRFVVSLPRADAPSAEAAAERQLALGLPPAGDARSTVLVVDDEEAVLTVVQFALERAGHAVIAFSSPLEALVRVEAGAVFGLALVDYSMPGLSGSEFIRHLRVRHPQVPVILMSGDLGRIRASVLGEELRFDLLQKPFDLGELVAAVGRRVAPAARPEA